MLSPAITSAARQFLMQSHEFLRASGARLHHQVFVPFLVETCVHLQKQGWTIKAIPDEVEVPIVGDDHILQLAGVLFGTEEAPTLYRLDIMCLFRTDYVMLELQLRDVATTSLLSTCNLLDVQLNWAASGTDIPDVATFFTASGCLAKDTAALANLCARFENKIIP